MRRTILILFCMTAWASSAQKHLFFYCPGPKEGLHVAYHDPDGSAGWDDLGQLFASDYGPWGAEKRMFNPYVLRARDGSWRAVFQVNENAPCFAATSSDDLLTWRPQDYPRMGGPGCHSPIVRETENGFDVHFASDGRGMRVTSASHDFRRFGPDRQAEIVFKIKKDQAEIGGKTYDGQLFDVDDETAQRLLKWRQKQQADRERFAETLREDEEKLLPRLVLEEENGQQVVRAELAVDTLSEKKISDRLIGVFFEDISRAADGGLYAELVQNRDFEYTAKDYSRGGETWGPATAWQTDGEVEIGTQNPLSPHNPHYAVVRRKALANVGFDGIAVKKGEKYDFSFYVRNMDKRRKRFTIVLTRAGEKGTQNVSYPVVVETEGREWTRYQAVLQATQTCADARLTLVPQKKGTAAVDMVSLFPQDTYKGHGLRRDLAEAIADLKPRFVRFPGGCMSHGQGLDNIYHWHHSIGPWQDRRPDFNIWHYHQTRGLGFYEYFQWCEDMGAEPLPVLAAGVPCQNSAADSTGYAGQQGGIPMADMDAYAQEFLHLIEWANGDPATSQWARMRAEAGHPEPFGLKYIGVGNEDLISTAFEDRCLAIAKTIRERYPDIQICGTVGPFHDPSSDYVEGWKLSNAHPELFDLQDEHYYESPGWFLNNQFYYDRYPRQGARVYLGEYASRTRTVESALAEAIHLCNIERNGDVVSMTSYAPLLCNEKHANWNPDLIYFDNESLTLTPSYHTQRLFGNYAGDRYVGHFLDARALVNHRVGTSVVRDSASGRRYLRVVNALPVALSLKVTGVVLPERLQAEGFCGQPADRQVQPVGQLAHHDDTLLLPAYSVVVVTLGGE